MTSKLSNICFYVKGKVSVESLTKVNYISTENMLPNRGGVVCATTLPTTEYTQEYCLGDVLVSNIRPYFKKIWFAESDGGCSNDVLVFRAKEGVNSKYLYYVLANDAFFNYSNATSKGTKMPRGDKLAIMEYEIEEHDPKEQKKIAEFLSAIDKKIAINNAINNNLQQQAQVLFKSYFVDFSKNINEDTYATYFGDIPKSFTITKMGELPLVITDYVANGNFASLKDNVSLLSTPDYAYFIRNTDLKSGNFGVFVNKHSYDFLAKSALFGNEIIISNVGDVGSVFLCPILDKPMTLGNNMIMVRPQDTSLNYYIYMWFKWFSGQGLIQGIKGGSAQPKFNKTDFRNLPTLVPPSVILNEFHRLVFPLFNKINNNTIENKKLALLRDSLLPKLMSGEIDVTDINI